MQRVYRVQTKRRAHVSRLCSLGGRILNAIPKHTCICTY